VNRDREPKDGRALLAVECTRRRGTSVVMGAVAGSESLAHCGGLLLGGGDARHVVELNPGGVTIVGGGIRAGWGGVGNGGSGRVCSRGGGGGGGDGVGGDGVGRGRIDGEVGGGGGGVVEAWVEGWGLGAWIFRRRGRRARWRR